MPETSRKVRRWKPPCGSYRSGDGERIDEARAHDEPVQRGPGRIARRERQRRLGGRGDDGPVFGVGDPRVLVAVERLGDLVDVAADRRVQLDPVAGPKLVEVPERLAEAGPVSGDADVARRVAGEGRRRI